MATSDELDRLKSEFMMLTSHELRNPLTKMTAWITLLQETRHKMTAEMQADGLQQLRNETEQLSRLIDNLLCIAQLKSGEIKIKIQNIDLESILRKVINSFSVAADQNRFIYTIAENCSEVDTDPERLALILSCLIDNAFKFSAAKEPVKITAKRKGDQVQIAIKDQGRMIPAHEVNQIFASFYQVESPLIRQQGGFGIGLYLARKLTERMNGKVWVDNSSSEGNTFIVSLPAHV